MHPVLLELGPLRLYSYGLLIALGGALSARFWHARRRRMGLPRDDDFWLFVNVILAGGFLGGRLLFLFEYTRPFSAEFWRTAVSFSRGFSVMGAFLGVTAGLWWLARRVRAPLPLLLDYVCAAAPLWHALGRVGCLLAGCCFGRPSTLPWALTFTDPRAMVDPAFLGVPLHPTQLYEAGGDLALAAVLCWLVLPAVESRRQPSGTVAVSYFLGYSLLRFITEFFRGDVLPIPGLGLTAAQALCVLLAAGAVALHLYSRQRTPVCIPS